MKKSIPFFALLLFLSFACNKGTDTQTTEGQSTIATPNDGQTQAEERFICCCDLIVTSVTFGGLIICGASGPGNVCQVNTNCGPTCGVQQFFPGPGKNITFCYENNCPVCFTNPAAFGITIQLNCGGLSGNIAIGPGATVCFRSDCAGNFQQCL